MPNKPNKKFPTYLFLRGAAETEEATKRREKRVKAASRSDVSIFEDLERGDFSVNENQLGEEEGKERDGDDTPSIYMFGVC